VSLSREAVAACVVLRQRCLQTLALLAHMCCTALSVLTSSNGDYSYWCPCVQHLERCKALLHTD
jgi:hypothetical protein